MPGKITIKNGVWLQIGQTLFFIVGGTLFLGNDKIEWEQSDLKVLFNKDRQVCWRSFIGIFNLKTYLCLFY